ncbi:Leucine Rich Repeat [Seminavis robusta]|uniref:Leucine Rich Repeat n=1 Tax=Seminavis robusta TaxID=568900 RepID=A0A9N8H106_9STRA|nr:Leucine Rich Repeat [Seminavis robusta]|eukprot:Sro9_g007170.1 Leucine Rich Repeat (769) ;mRNA; r:68314-70792
MRRSIGLSSLVLFLCCLIRTGSFKLFGTVAEARTSSLFRLEYRGDFQLQVSGLCGPDEPAELEAVCQGEGLIDFEATSDESIQCVQTNRSSIECTTTLQEVYKSNSTFGSIFYACEGNSSNDLQSTFVYTDSSEQDVYCLETEDGAVNQIWHLSRLNILCADSSNDAAAESITNGSLSTAVNDDYFFECQGQNVHNFYPDNKHPSNEFWCTNGKLCEGDCNVTFQPLQVLTDIHHVPTACILQLEPEISGPYEATQPATSSLLPPHHLQTVYFTVNFAWLLKSDDFQSVSGATCIVSAPSFLLTCDNGIIEWLSSPSRDSVNCRYIDDSVLNCTAIDLPTSLPTLEASYVNQFQSIQYSCQSNYIPTTVASMNNGTTVCAQPDAALLVTDIYFALQLGVQCAEDTLYDDSVIECGMDTIFSFMDSQTNPSGSPFGWLTCLNQGTTLIQEDEELLVQTIPEVTVSTDWRFQTGPNPDCFSVEEQPLQTDSPTFTDESTVDGDMDGENGGASQSYQIVELPDFTIGVLQVSPDSPQAKAYRWMKWHPYLDELPQWRRQQQFALVTFFYSFGGDVPGVWFDSDLENYLDYDVHECEWGETRWALVDSQCNEEGAYTQLSLDGTATTDLRGLVGTMPPEISLLSSLEEIRISGTDLAQTLSAMIPIELAGMTSLREFSYSANHLVGNIPTTLGLFTQLTSLFLGFNRLGGSVPSEIGLLTNLLNFNIHCNNIRGSVTIELFGRPCGPEATTVAANGMNRIWCLFSKLWAMLF